MCCVAMFSAIGHARHIQLYSYIGNISGSIRYIRLCTSILLYSASFCIFAIFMYICYICYVQLSLLSAPYWLHGAIFHICAIFIYIRYIRAYLVYSLLQQFRYMHPNQLYAPDSLHGTIFAVFANVRYFRNIQPYSAMFASILDLGRPFLQMAGPPKPLCARLCAGLCAALCGPFCAQVPLGAGWPPVRLTFVHGHWYHWKSWFTAMLQAAPLHIDPPVGSVVLPTCCSKACNKQYKCWISTSHVVSFVSHMSCQCG